MHGRRIVGACLRLHLDFMKQTRVPLKIPARHLVFRPRACREQVRRASSCGRLQREVQNEMPLSGPEMVRVPVARFYDQYFSRLQLQLLAVQLAEIWPALHQDRFIVRVPVSGILVERVHLQTVEVRENRLNTHAAMTRVHAMITLFFEHGRRVALFTGYPWMPFLTTA